MSQQKQILVLGGGMVGTIIAEDLAAEPGFQVTLADRSSAALARAQERCPALATQEADLSDAATVQRLAAEHDLVAGALSSRIGKQAMRAVIEAGRPFADISFMAEDLSDLDALARERGVCVVMDCGVAPGMSNLLSGYGVSLLDRADSLEILVGGLPVVRSQPWQYKAGFAPSDVLEEYTRPARFVAGGQQQVCEALTDPAEFEFEGIGTLEGPITDGLRTLVRLPVANMVERTLRYPGHTALMRALRQGGFFSSEPVDVGGVPVVPREATSAIMFPDWTYQPGEEDLTVMRITVEGERGGQRVRLAWDLDARYDRERSITSMARSTAFPCAIAARMLARGAYDEPGVHAPEDLAGRPDLVQEFLDGCRARGLVYRASETVLPA